MAASPRFVFDLQSWDDNDKSANPGKLRDDDKLAASQGVQQDVILHSNVGTIWSTRTQAASDDGVGFGPSAGIERSPDVRRGSEGQSVDGPVPPKAPSFKLAETQSAAPPPSPPSQAGIKHFGRAGNECDDAGPQSSRRRRRRCSSSSSSSSSSFQHSDGQSSRGGEVLIANVRAERRDGESYRGENNFSYGGTQWGRRRR
ncbi:hypothetical protein OC844_003405 [Tilletia horrida]|nr:hypothetical protein OC844_003405 [Tilletia horrida]